VNDTHASELTHGPAGPSGPASPVVAPPLAEVPLDDVWPPDPPPSAVGLCAHPVPARASTVQTVDQPATTTLFMRINRIAPRGPACARRPAHRARASVRANHASEAYMQTANAADVTTLRVRRSLGRRARTLIPAALNCA